MRSTSHTVTPLFYVSRRLVNPHNLNQTGAWVLLQCKLNKLPEELRIMETRRAKRDIKLHRHAGWTTVLAMFVHEFTDLGPILDTLTGKMRNKVRGLVSKAALAESIARSKHCDLFVNFNDVFKDPTAEQRLIRHRRKKRR